MSHDLSNPHESSSLSAAQRALKDAARRVLSRRFRVVLLVRDAYERMLSHSDVLSAVLSDLRTMMRLLLQWATRSYKRVSWTPLLVIVVALLYFVTPLDAIPDTFGALGFIDDVTVLSTAIESVRSELRQFRMWEHTRTLSD